MTDVFQIAETIVVEGASDASNIARVCKANFIITHGLHISKETYHEIELAARAAGIIVFSDPDGPGASIRRKIEEYIEKKRAENGDIYKLHHAYLSTDEARRKKDIGVENASEESLIRALSKLKTARPSEDIYSPGDLDDYGLSGAGSKKLREALCKELNLGYANAKLLLKKLNSYHIERLDLEEALIKVKRGEV